MELELHGKDFFCGDLSLPNKTVNKQNTLSEFNLTICSQHCMEVGNLRNYEVATLGSVAGPWSARNIITC